MIRRFVRERNIFAAQRLLAAGAFGLLFVAYASAYLLNLFPASEILWRISIPANRLAEPVATQIDSIAWLNIEPLIAAFAIAALVPLTGFVRRSWLGTAICGHVALALMVLYFNGALKSVSATSVSASLNPVYAVGELGPGGYGLGVMALFLIAACVLNHVAFFRRARQS